jgi:hypothetical protein
MREAARRALPVMAREVEFKDGAVQGDCFVASLLAMTVGAIVPNLLV